MCKVPRADIFPSRPPRLTDMRKAMPRDVEKRSVVPLARPVRPHELEFD